MEFPQLDTQCALPDCRQLDFLPFKCTKCGRTFCLTHRNQHSPCFDASTDVPVCPICNQPVPVLPGQEVNQIMEAHISSNCTKTPASAVPKASRCTRPGCKALELVPIVCNKCGKNFCLPHRLPMDHNCESLVAAAAPPPKAPPQQERKHWIQKKVEDYNTARQKKMAAQLELMKMKQHAKGDPKIPADQRFYLEVVFPMESKAHPKYMFFNRSWSVGKVLDLAADAGGIENNNNKPGAEKLHLMSLKTGLPLPNDLTLNDLHEIIVSGDAILLEREA